jgi:hypothetical protein
VSGSTKGVFQPQVITINRSYGSKPVIDEYSSQPASFGTDSYSPEQAMG